MAEAHREEIAKLEALYAAHPEGRVFTHLAEAYRRAGQLDRAREILDDGLRRHPDYSSAHVVFGRVLMDLEQTDGAASAFRRVLDLDRHNLVALRSLGDLAVRAGDRAAAVGYYRELIALDPTDDRLRITVARLEEELAETGAPSLAEEPAPAGEPGAAADEAPAAALAEGATDEPMPFETAAEESPWTPAEPLEVAEPEPSAPEPQEEALEPGAFQDLGSGLAPEPEEAELSFPTLEEGDVDESTFVYGAGTLDVEGLTLDWSESDDAAGLAEDVEGSVAEDAPAPVDEMFEEPESVPDAFAGMGWQAGEESGGDMTGEEPADEAEPAGDEAIVADDDTWTSVGERAAATWDAEPQAPDPEDVEEIRTWGPVRDEEASVFEETPVEPEPVHETAEGTAEPLAEEAGAELEVVGETVVARATAVGDVVTATMAELYAQQGFFDRSIDVYRQLLEQVPEDERLRDRLAELEALTVDVAEVEDSAAEAASVWTDAGRVAGGEETPYAWSDTAAADEAGGPASTAGDYFRSLLGWRPSAAGGLPEEAAGTLELTEEHAVADEPAEAAEAPLEAGAVEAAFEEWFGDSPEDRAEGGGEADDEPAEEDADLAMFRSWLQSLKK